jgi:Na+-driven multidrug efflux pump
VLLLTTWAAAAGGDVPLAAYQVSSTVWTLLTFALDALAIAAQALTGRALGAGDAAGARELTALMVRWGVAGGVVLGALVLAAAPVVPALLTSDPAVRSALAGALVVVALQQPLSGLVFVLDGVLIGAGDGRWLAGAQVLLLVAYLPVAFVVRTQELSAAGLWIGFAVFMALRGLALSWRARSEAWAVVGAHR